MKPDGWTGRRDIPTLPGWKGGQVAAEHAVVGVGRVGEAARGD